MGHQDPSPAANNSSDDLALLARLHSDDARALGILMDRYAAPLHRFIAHIVRRRDLADDVVQDVFISLWERRAEVTVTTSFRSYLYRAARNLALNVVRHEQVEVRAQASLLDHVDADGVATASAHARNEGETAMAALELEGVIRDALATLQPQVREVFLLRHTHGLSYTEIAATMGVQVVTVRSQMSRALRVLSEAVDRRWR